eukprot:scaffold1970_cov396-Prasinococcus_capsulatus_cf.AAC.14
MELASHETISLAVGFSLVSQAFQNHTRDACITALKHLASDKVGDFCQEHARSVQQGRRLSIHAGFPCDGGLGVPFSLKR